MEKRLMELKNAEQLAFDCKKIASNALKEAKKNLENLLKQREQAWERRILTREIVDHEADRVEKAKDAISPILEEYERIRKENYKQIDALHAEAKEEHQKMQGFLKEANKKFEFGKNAKKEIKQAKFHEDRRNELNAKAHSLNLAVKEARKCAKKAKESIDEQDYKDAVERYHDARKKHKEICARISDAQAHIHECAKEYEVARAEHKRAKKEFYDYLNSI